MFVHPTHVQTGPQWPDRRLHPQLFVLHPFLQLQPLVKKYSVPFHYLTSLPVNNIVVPIFDPSALFW